MSQPQPGAPDVLEKLVSLAKQRGFFFGSSEIYGGINALYDYGPLGARMRRNVRNLWWRAMVERRDDVEPIETSIIMNPQVWVASGHVDTFTDPLVDCQGTCRKRWRADHVADERRARGKPEDAPGCPECGGPLTDARQFNLMFRTHLGPVADDAAQVYLRPETAQGMFVDFAVVVQAMRRRLPFGIAQQGKAFRNEISPSNSIFRTREFEQMEMEFFCKPGTDMEWHRYWCDERMRWWTEDCGVRGSRLRLRAHEADELSHYSTATSDVEYLFPWGWGELEGVADRTDFDLRAHSKHSGRDLSYFDTETNERYLPYVIEPAAGLDRAFLTMLLDAWDEEEVRGEKRTVLRLHPDVAPWEVAVLPLSKKAQLTDVAHPLAARLRARFRTEYDETQSIGRRYRRQDEIGTPLAVTVDFDSLEDNAVTIRERDGMTQVRVPIEGLEDACAEQLAACRAASLERSRR
ncbi:MAG: glycine--tRNA ligase [Candidatus Dormibacteraeota bacterium]|uniref:Glycine--tRNA ligase n=1 Tax=Candidatus Aeolococcus gillhamiae TaxID=3127015 RepID=A0A934NAU3_9BACT|nr:glycine--tRNA ligase [Candidatus Dormibacteraeota bacterium]